MGFEAAHLSVAEHASLSPASVRVGHGSQPGLIEQARRSKDAAEIDRLQHAAQIADQALAARCRLLAGEPTEVQFRDQLEASMRTLGADGPSFDTIVAAGANAALPHHRPDDTRIIEGMTVVLDFGSLYRRLSQRHDPHICCWSPDINAGRGVQRGAAGANGRSWRGARRELRAAHSTTCAGSSPARWLGPMVYAWHRARGWPGNTRIAVADTKLRRHTWCRDVVTVEPGRLS